MLRGYCLATRRQPVLGQFLPDSVRDSDEAEPVQVGQAEERLEEVDEEPHGEGGLRGGGGDDPHRQGDRILPALGGQHAQQGLFAREGGGVAKKIYLEIKARYSSPRNGIKYLANFL